MASQVDICNNALTKLGAGRISSISDTGRNAKALAAIWNQQRDTELTMHPWTFATTRAQLPASSTPPAYGWSYAYPLASDYLSLVEIGDRWVWNADDPELYTLEGSDAGQQVLTDFGSPLPVRYVRRVTNPGLFAPLFCEALACRLAAVACEEITQSLSKQQARWTEYKEAISQARRINAIALPPRRVADGTWVRALTDDADGAWSGPNPSFG
jgi:hypothetical protein